MDRRTALATFLASATAARIQAAESKVKGEARPTRLKIIADAKDDAKIMLRAYDDLVRELKLAEPVSTAPAPA